MTSFYCIGNKHPLYLSQVHYEKAKSLAEFHGCPLLVTSAKTREGVIDAFHSLVREIRKWRKREEAIQCCREFHVSDVTFQAGFPAPFWQELKYDVQSLSAIVTSTL